MAAGWMTSCTTRKFDLRLTRTMCGWLQPCCVNRRTRRTITLERVNVRERKVKRRLSRRRHRGWSVGAPCRLFAAQKHADDNSCTLVTEVTSTRNATGKRVGGENVANVTFVLHEFFMHVSGLLRLPYDSTKNRGTASLFRRTASANAKGPTTTKEGKRT